MCCVDALEVSSDASSAAAIAFTDRYVRNIASWQHTDQEEHHG